MKNFGSDRFDHLVEPTDIYAQRESVIVGLRTFKRCVTRKKIKNGMG